jgi:hypothetical protein
MKTEAPCDRANLTRVTTSPVVGGLVAPVPVVTATGAAAGTFQATQAALFSCTVQPPKRAAVQLVVGDCRVHSPGIIIARMRGHSPVFDVFVKTRGRVARMLGVRSRLVWTR